MTLTPAEVEHARSVGDPDDHVTLVPIPTEPKPKILVASVVRKPLVVTQAFATALAATQFPEADLSYYFVNDGCSDEALAPLAALPASEIVPPAQQIDGHYADGAITREWSPGAFQRMAALRNQCLQKALDARADALYLIDADVLGSPSALRALWLADAPIVSGVYWTAWTAGGQPMPQVWLRHSYGLDNAFGFGADPAEFLRALRARARTQVGGLGAVTLIRTDAITKGVSYTPIPEGLPPGPMSDGEDRHFAERARRLHVPLYADAWPDYAHLYHASEVERANDALQWLARPTIEKPSVGDEVNVRLDVIEPVVTQAGVQYVMPQFVRGRLGALPVLPAIEQQVAALPVGERAICEVVFPQDWPFAPLRGARRLIAVTLQAARPFRLPWNLA